MTLRAGRPATTARRELAIPALDRVRLRASVAAEPGSAPERAHERIVLRGAMGEAGRPVLALHLLTR